jgi:aromatic ring hydroxylase
VRNLSRYAWVTIGSAPYDPERKDADGTPRPVRAVRALDVAVGDTSQYTHQNWTQEDLEDKRRALRLMGAFVAAAKHHVRCAGIVSSAVSI